MIHFVHLFRISPNLAHASVKGGAFRSAPNGWGDRATSDAGPSKLYGWSSIIVPPLGTVPKNDQHGKGCCVPFPPADVAASRQVINYVGYRSQAIGTRYEQTQRRRRSAPVSWRSRNRKVHYFR